MDREPYARTISRALELFEGYATLAVILNVRVADLRRWADGTAYPPGDVLRRLAGLNLNGQREAADAVTAQVRRSAWPPAAKPW